MKSTAVLLNTCITSTVAEVTPVILKATSVVTVESPMQIPLFEKSAEVHAAIARFDGVVKRLEEKEKNDTPTNKTKNPQALLITSCICNFPIEWSVLLKSVFKNEWLINDANFSEEF